MGLVFGPDEAEGVDRALTSLPRRDRLGLARDRLARVRTQLSRPIAILCCQESCGRGDRQWKEHNASTTLWIASAGSVMVKGFCRKAPPSHAFAGAVSF